MGGGGVAGVAWLLGLAASLAEGGVDLNDADVIVGTSAGAAVGAVLRSGADLDDMVARQRDPSSAELAPQLDLRALAEMFAPGRTLAEIGARAVAADTVPEPDRLAAIRSRLPVTDWPAQPLRVTAVDTGTGQRVVFTRDSGVPLDLAVAASCAVPGVWPPVTIDGRRYMDGGVHSIVNADLGTDADRILLLAPTTWSRHGRVADEAEDLRRQRPVHLVTPDPDSTRAMGPNPLDPATRPAAVAAGLAQGRAVTAEVRAFLHP